MFLRWQSTLILASAVSAAKPKYCNSPSFTTRTAVSPTPTSTSTTTTTTDPTASYSDSCTYRPTQTYYSSSGCAHTCATGLCIIDAPATISCGCPKVFIETQTVTICATTTPCWECRTGWGTFLYTQPCSTGTGSASATPTSGE